MNKNILVVIGILAALLTAAGIMNMAQSISEQIRVDGHRKGFAYYDKEDYDKAITEFNKVIKFDCFGDVHNSMGLAYWGKKDYDQAIRYFSKAIEFRPESYTSYFNRSLTYFEWGKYDKALADLNKMMEIGAHDESIDIIWKHRGQCYFHLGEYKKAIDDLSKALENIDLRNLSNRNYYFYRGSSYAKMGDYQKAITDFNAALTFWQFETVSDEEIKRALKEAEIEQAKESK